MEKEGAAERIIPVGHKGLDQAQALSHGPGSEFLPKEMGEYWEIYSREWQDLALFLLSMGLHPSRALIFLFQPVCASPQGDGKDPAAIRGKKTPRCSASNLAVWLCTSDAPSLNRAPGIWAQHPLNICWITGHKYACFPAMSFLLSGAIFPPWKRPLEIREHHLKMRSRWRLRCSNIRWEKEWNHIHLKSDRRTGR